MAGNGRKTQDSAAAPITRNGRKVISNRQATAYCRTMLRPTALIVALTAAVARFSLPAAAQSLDIDQILQAEILPGWRAPDGQHFAALHLTLAPGWHTYWRTPGASGIPPDFGWQGSANLTALTVHWPVPGVFSINGAKSIGYTGDLVLPLELTTGQPDQPVDLALTADLGVCKEICVPVSLTLNAALGVAAAPEDAAITSALSSRPIPAKVAGLSALTCRVEPIADGLRVTADMVLPPTGSDELGVIELDSGGVWASPPEMTRTGNALRLVADLVPPGGAPFVLDRSQVRITILGSDRAVEAVGCPAS